MTDIAEIRARHEAADATLYHWAIEHEAHADRAVLLARVAELESINAQQREVLYLYAVQHGTVTTT